MNSLDSQRQNPLSIAALTMGGAVAAWRVALLAALTLLTQSTMATAARVVQWVEDDIAFAGRPVATITERVPALATVSPTFSELGAVATITVTGTRLDTPAWTFVAQRRVGGPVNPVVAGVAPDGRSLTFDLPQSLPFPSAGTYDLFFRTPARESNRLAFVISELGGPVLFTVSPPVGSPGETITLGGLRFKTPAGLIHSDAPTDRDPPPTSWTDTSATFVVPASWEATSGPRTFQLWVEDRFGDLSNQLTFRTAVMPGVIDSVDPSVTVPGERVTLRGRRFGATPGLVYLRPAGDPERSLSADSWSDTLVTFTVPPMAPLPRLVDVWLVRSDSEPTNSRVLDVRDPTQPRIVSIVPSSASKDHPTPVAVSGFNFVSGTPGGTTTFTFILGGTRYPAVLDLGTLTPTHADLTTPRVPIVGWADLEVDVQDVGKDTRPAFFLFDRPPAPIVRSLKPQYVRANSFASDVVYLEGEYFTPDAEVLVDGVLVSSNASSDTKLIFYTQSHPAGPVEVVVRRSGDPTRAFTWGDDPTEPPLTFVDHTWFGDYYVQGTGRLPFTHASWADFSGEGWSDILFCGRDREYNETRLIDHEEIRPWNSVTMTTLLGTGSPDDYRGATWGDVDNDGTVDVYLVRDGAPGLLFVNPAGVPGFEFEDVTLAWGLTSAPASTAATFVDYDRDGLLDLYLVVDGANVLYRNAGSVFVDVTAATGVGDTGPGVAAAVTDLDGDLFPELFVINEGAANVLYENQGDGTFTDCSTSCGLSATTFDHTNAAFADYDLDGHVDVYVTAEDGNSRLYHNRGNGTFVAAVPQPEEASGQPMPSVDCAWADVDGDGDPELFVANHQTGGNRLFYRLQQFGDAWAELGSNNYKSGFNGTATSLAVADYPKTSDSMWQSDRGTPDVVISQDGSVSNYHSWVGINIAPSEEWMRVRLRGTVSNQAAVGANVTLEANGTAYSRDLESASGNELGQSFWFAAPTVPDRLTVRWPSGIEQVFRDAALTAMRNRDNVVVEPTERIFLSEYGSGSLSKFDPITESQLWSVPATPRATWVAVRPQGDEAFVVGQGPSSFGPWSIMQVLVPRESTTDPPVPVNSIPLGSAAGVMGLAVRDQGRQLVVLDSPTGTDAELRVLERATVPTCPPIPCFYDYAEVDRILIPGSGRARQLVLDPTGRFAYVVDPFNIRIDWVDLEATTTRGSIPMSGAPLSEMTFDPRGDHFYLAVVRPTWTQFKPGFPWVLRDLGHVMEYSITGGDPATASATADFQLHHWAEVDALGWLRFDTSRQEVYAYVGWRGGPPSGMRVSTITGTVNLVPDPVGPTDAEFAGGHVLWMSDSAGDVVDVTDVLALRPLPPIRRLLAPQDLAVGPARP